MLGLSLGKWILLILVAVLAQRAYRLYEAFKPYPGLKFNDENCVLKGEMFGAEDLVLGKDSVILFGSAGSTGGLDVCFTQGSENTGSGGIWMFDLKDLTGQPRQLTINNYPHSNPLHAHGIYLSNATDRLYVVNHLGQESVIEVISVEYSPVRLTHQKTVRSDLFYRYIMNDVVEGKDENEIYVSRWQPFNAPPFSGVNTLAGALGLPLTFVIRCDLKKDECEVASRWLFAGANGMTVTPDRSTYFVADPLERRIGVMARQPNGFLEHKEWIHLPQALDNLEYDSVSGDITFGTIPDLVSGTKRMEDKSANVPGGLSLVRKAGDAWKMEDIIAHTGDKLSQISAGVRYGKTVVLGSPFSKGILVCSL